KSSVARSGAAAIDAALSSIDDAELIALTRDLVRIPSVIRPGDATATEAEVARYIERWFGKQGFGVEVHEVAPGRPNVVAWLGDTDGGRSLLLEGHTDVVTEGDPRERTHSPFGAALVGTSIYGRRHAGRQRGRAAAMSP